MVDHIADTKIPQIFIQHQIDKWQQKKTLYYIDKW